MDISSQPQIDAAVEAVRTATGGKLDILINNAAAFNLMPLADQNLDDARKLFEVNFFGLLAVTQAFLPLLIAIGGDAIVANVSSISVTAEPVYQGIYAASKAAIFTMSGSMRKELAPLGVRVVTIMSGAVDTNFKDNSPWKVPKDSFYYELAGEIESKKSTSKFKGMAPDAYAKKVVGDLLRSCPGPVIFRGKFASAIWVLSWLGWYGVLDSSDIQGNKLDTIKARRE
jgi:NAD(P)-dependent dehydrogenase (short-subunit alcohol dehydrogenase family)